MNTKMKLLSLAMLGLGSIGFAGVASAACPTSPTAWSQVKVGGSGDLNITAGGLDSSACKLDASVSGTGLLTSAYVQDDSPNNELSYRAQFLVNIDGLSDFSFGDTFKLFSAVADSIVNVNNELVRITLVSPGVAGGTPQLSIATACDTESQGLCSLGVVGLSPGTNRIEIEWVAGTGSNDGIMRAWINNTSEASPDFEMTSLSNDAWTSGVTSARLGIIAPTNSFQAGHASEVLSVDSFDSRRTTFIGG